MFSKCVCLSLFKTSVVSGESELLTLGGKDIFTRDVTLYHLSAMWCQEWKKNKKKKRGMCVSAAASRGAVLIRASNILIRSEEVTPNTSEAIYKLPALTASSYICSRAARHRVHAYTTQYTARWLRKSISKPHPLAFSSDNTPVMRMDTDCLCCLGYFSCFLAPI